MAIDLQSDQTKIEEQVARIIASPKFKNSAILSDFLEFIVSETLGGKGDQLKEYVIATQILKKKTDFNPQLNAVVRIHARRLRGSLEDYYRNTGMNDPVIISVPKGRYLPVFEINDINHTVHSTGRVIERQRTTPKPLIAILPLKHFDEDQRIKVISSVFCQDLSIEFTRFDEIGVISNYSSQAVTEKLNDLREIGLHLGTEYLITGSCQMNENKVKITLELNSILNNQLLWAESYYIEDIETDKLRNYSTIIRKVVAVVSGYMGIIYRDVLNKYVPEDFGHIYAVYWHNRYHQNFSEEAFQEALKAVETGLQHNPRNAFLWAIHGQLHLDLLAMGIQSDIRLLKTGTTSAQRAISLDSNCQHGYQILAWACLLNHDKKDFIRSMMKCLSINPNNVMYSGTAGFGFICAGEYEDGIKYMTESIHLNPFYFWVLNIGFCLYYIHAWEYKEALYWAELINRPRLLWDHLLKASIYGLINKKDGVEEEVVLIYDLAPDFPLRAREIVGRFILDEKLTEIIIQGLIQAGIPIP